eukprot:2652529-Pyramimonas_sp.AAC.1
MSTSSGVPLAQPCSFQCAVASAARGAREVMVQGRYREVTLRQPCSFQCVVASAARGARGTVARSMNDATQNQSREGRQYILSARTNRGRGGSIYPA